MFPFIIILIILVALSYFLYTHYQIRKLPQVSAKALGEKLEDHHVVVDLRDFNISYKTPIDGAINIPSAYLKRYYKELPMKQSLLIATTDSTNVGPDALFLKRKGHRVVGIVELSELNKPFMECNS